MKRKKRIELYHLTPYERMKLQYVEDSIAEGLNPLNVSIDTIGGEIKFNIKDIRHWQMKHKKDFLTKFAKNRKLSMKHTS